MEQAILDGYDYDDDGSDDDDDDDGGVVYLYVMIKVEMNWTIVNGFI